MRKRTIMVLALLSALLAGCAPGREARRFAEFQRSATEALRIEFEAAVTAGGGAGAAYRLRVTLEESEIRTEVIEPETIRGVTLRSGGDGRTLEYDGLILDLMPERPDALSPCAAGSTLLGAVREGSLLYTGRAGDNLTAALTAPGGEQVTLRLSASNEPVYAEIGRGDDPELIVHIEHWGIQE